MRFETSSSANALIMNGKGVHILNPWHIMIDTEEETITVRKRNAILIGVDEQVCAFRFIRSITIDQHLFGADIHIKIVGSYASAFCIPKSDAKEIKKYFSNTIKQKRGRVLYFLRT